MKKQEKTAPRFSEEISHICAVLEAAQDDYRWNSDMIKTMEQLTQDYLHKLELENLNYAERAKIATQLAICRQERREHKDTVTILEPLVQYLDSEKGKQLYNLLREVLGKTRKAEERMADRVYWPRVLASKCIR